MIPRVKISSSLLHQITRSYASCSGGGQGIAKKGLVLGVYEGCSPGDFKFTKSAADFDKRTSGKLSELLKGTGVALGEAMMFTNINDDYYGVAVGGLGPEGVGYDVIEHLNVCKENIRIATALATRKLQDNGITQIVVEDFTMQEPAVESAALTIWQFQDLKSPEDKKPNPTLEPYNEADKDGWQRGMTKADSQNFARYLEEVPANIMTPTRFAELIVDNLCPCGVQVTAYDRDWMETKKMGALLAVADTSCEPPLFIEMKYCGGNPRDQPIVLVGKGITYDTGGLTLKNKHIMSEYRGDLAAGAVVAATIRCVARMALPINVIGLVPLCENVIGAMSTRPGDVVMASDGKSVRIAHPDNEGRIMLADAVVYAVTHRPCLTIAISTMTPGMKKTCGSGASGVYTNSHETWVQMDMAGAETGDRLWRFPSFWEMYKTPLIESSSVDVTNYIVKPGNSSQAAAFLKEFYSQDGEFAHIDIAGTGMLSTGVGHPYLRKGLMTGRPVRTLAQFMYQVSCPHTPPEC